MQTVPLRLLAFFASIAVFGSILYYGGAVTTVGLILVVLASAGIAALPFRLSPRSARATHRPPGAALAIAGVGVLALAAWWSAVLPVAITDAVRSPWGIVPVFSVAALGIALFCGIALLRRHGALGASLLLATLFSGVSMAAVVYPLGFGFDPFLHRATVAHIAEFGTITPKPLYYIGQYAIELVLTLLARLPLTTVDHILLPVLTTLFIGTSAWYGLRDRMTSAPALVLAGLVFLPLGAFVSTTPQGIAYVFTASVVLLSFGATPAWLLALLALASLLTHPLAGIPTALFVAAHLLARRVQPSLQPLVIALAGVASVAAIPVLFAVQAARSGLSLEAHLGNILEPARWSGLALSGFLTNNFSTGFDALYLVVGNLFLLTVIIAAVGIFRIRRERLAWLPVAMASGMFLNFLTLSIVFDFDFLISYERQDYAVRALTLTVLFLLPFACIAVADLLARLAKKPVALHASCIALLAFIGAANIYGAYPRHDNYTRSAGFNVSTADVDAVYEIHERGGDEPYIVLANQATSAAAVAAFGFSTYYHTDIFYYPIPTGGPLYEQFLAMVNEAPARATMETAMDLAGVDLAFFAVSDYWWQSDAIIENAKRIADDWFSVDEDKVTVFIFHR